MQINSGGSRETRLATQLAAAEARIAELEKEVARLEELQRDSARELEQFSNEIAAHRACVERLGVALREYACDCEERECKSASINPRACGFKARAALAKG
jgi:chromosome segregation ATPase